ncbi:hypothetical protein ACWDYH_00305 [Nocardia goodfellowii]
MARFSAAGIEFNSKAKTAPTHAVLITENGVEGIYSKHSSIGAAEKSKKDRERPYYVKVDAIRIVPVVKISD